MRVADLEAVLDVATSLVVGRKNDGYGRSSINFEHAVFITECPGIVAYHRADIGCLISNGWNGFGSDGREVGCTIKFFINLANEDDHVAFDEVEP